VLDDVDDVFKADLARKIIMNLCESDEHQRTVAWYGTESQLKVKRGSRVIPVPQEFTTSSRVCVICNDWGILTRSYTALLDRGTVAFFEPTSGETHRFVGTWFEDDEIYKFIGQHLSDIPRHSIRYYTTSKELKSRDLPWQESLVESWTSEVRVPKSKREEMDRDHQVAVQIYCEEQTTADRHRRWRIETGKGHSTFDAHVKDARAAGLLAKYQAGLAIGKSGKWENTACVTVEGRESAVEMAEAMTGTAAMEELQAGTPSESLVRPR
jgi:hypothetical protein